MSEEQKPKAGIYEQGHPGEKIETPEGVDVEALNKWLEDPAVDLKLKQTVAYLIKNVNNSAHQCQLLMNALALILHSKYAPLNVRQNDLDKLPTGWEIHIIPVSETHYQIKFSSPIGQKSSLLILPPNARN